MKVIKYLNSEIEYIQSREDKIVTIISIKSSDEEMPQILRRLETLAKRIKIKEIWMPNIDEPKLEALGYKKCILGYHEAQKQALRGYKKILW